jgi:hypothetical protein
MESLWERASFSGPCRGPHGAGKPTTEGKRADTMMDACLSVHSVVSATPEQVSCPLGDEAAILNLKNTVYYGLNPVGARVWNLLQQPRSVGELRDALLKEYDVEPGRCESDLLELLEKMRTEGLIQVQSAAGAGG